MDAGWPPNAGEHTKRPSDLGQVEAHRSGKLYARAHAAPAHMVWASVGAEAAPVRTRSWASPGVRYLRSRSKPANVWVNFLQRRGGAVDPKLTKLRSLITESLRVQRGGPESIPYIDVYNTLSDV